MTDKITTPKLVREHASSGPDVFLLDERRLSSPLPKARICCVRAQWRHYANRPSLSSRDPSVGHAFELFWIVRSASKHFASLNHHASAMVECVSGKVLSSMRQVGALRVPKILTFRHAANSAVSPSYRPSTHNYLANSGTPRPFARDERHDLERRRLAQSIAVDLSPFSRATSIIAAHDCRVS